MNNDNMPTKLDNIKTEIKQMLFFACAIDDRGKIIDLQRYTNVINQTIAERESALRANTTIDGVPLNREIVSVLMGEIAYLKNIKTHKENLDELIEHPIKDRVDYGTEYNFKSMFQDITRVARRVSGVAKRYFQR